MGRLGERLRFYRNIRFWTYIRYNYFCKQIERQGRKLIPYKGAVLDLAKGSRLVIQNGDVEIGCERLRGSKAETFVRLREGAVWQANGGCKLNYCTTLELLKDAQMESGYFTMNTGSTIVAAKHIHLGTDVMIARNAVIYDSDFHPLRNENGEITNPPADVTIGDHVWLAANVTVLKGAAIGNGAVIGAGTKVSGIVGDKSLVVSPAELKTIRENVNWTRG